MYNNKVMLEDTIQISILYDFYGPLLSDRQQQLVDLYFNENLSMTEISSELGISKQAVSVGLKTAEKSLKTFEEKLGLVERWQNEIGLTKGA